MMTLSIGRRNRVSGFTLIEMIMVMALLGVIGVLVLPILEKPFWIYHSGKQFQQASSDAIKVMHWIERDTAQRDIEVSIELSQPSDDEYALIIARGEVRYATEQSPETGLYTLLRAEKQGQHVRQSPIADDIEAIAFDWQPPYLSITMTMVGGVGKGVTFWRQWEVGGESKWP